MATLQKIRNKAGLLVGALGIALLAFILGELLNSGGSIVNKFKDKAFEVNGDVVSTGEYQYRVTQMEGFQKMFSQRNNLTEDEIAQIREQVFQQMVKEMILDNQTSKLGMAVTKEEMNDLVYGQNLSPVIRGLFGDPQSGQVNKQALDNYLRAVTTDPASAANPEERAQIEAVRAQWLIIENMIKYQRLEEKYNALFAGSLLVNDIEAKANFEATRQAADIAYVTQKYTSIADSTITVSDSEIKELFNKRKNNFRVQNDLRRISYFYKDVVPSPEDYENIESEMNKIQEKLAAASSDDVEQIIANYSEVPFSNVFVSNRNMPAEVKTFVETASSGDVLGPIRGNENFSLHRLMDRTVRPDSIKLQLISIPEGTEKNVAQNFADSIFNVIKGGKDFAVVANELDPRLNGGEMGWVTEENLVANKAEHGLISAIYNAQIGELTKYSTKGMIFLIKVSEKTQPITKYKLATVSVSVPVSEKTMNGIDRELNTFVSENGDKANFVDAANQKGYNLLTDVLLNPAQNSLSGLPNTRQVIHWAFNEDIGSVKKFETERHRIVALITDEIEAGFFPYTEPQIYDMLKAEILRGKKAEKIIADMKAKNAATLEAYAQALNTKVDTTKFVSFGTPSIQGLGREPIINVFAKHGQVDALTAPLRGESGVFVLKVLNREEQATEFDPVAIKAQMQRNHYYLANQVIRSLERVMRVRDNRVRFF